VAVPQRKPLGKLFHFSFWIPRNFRAFFAKIFMTIFFFNLLIFFLAPSPARSLARLFSGNFRSCGTRRRSRSFRRTRRRRLSYRSRLSLAQGCCRKRGESCRRRNARSARRSGRRLSALNLERFLAFIAKVIVISHDESLSKISPL